MCGILFSAIHKKQSGSALNRFSELRSQLENTNGARGPDSRRCLEAVIKNDSTEAEPSDGGLMLWFFASELLLRGDRMVVQPHHDEELENLFCWNGEVFEGLDVGTDENDGVKLFLRLQLCESSQDISDLFGEIEGPYAFVFYQKSTGRLYFARDPLGRRSLLIHKPTNENPYFILGSVSIGQNADYTFEELDTECFFCLDLDKLATVSDVATEFGTCLTRVARHDESRADFDRAQFAQLSQVNPSLPGDDPAGVRSLSDAIPSYLADPVDQFISRLDRSVMLHVRDIARHSKSSGRASVAVLFSGGIDSTFLAFLAHRHVPLDEPIDLLNVAFENPRKIQVSSNDKRNKNKTQGSLGTDLGAVSYLVPDRVTGLMEVEELKRLCPGRVWNFVEVDVPYEESQAARPLVEAIMFPAKTVMDLSLAMALYFASRGKGTIRRTPDAHPEEYLSYSRVLLNGLGSDELLGGYGRYRTAYGAAGWNAVIEELQLDLDRIPVRNLGRDDRIISSHGKETRHPFLSISVVNFVSELPVHLKVDPRLDAGVGDKLLLRLAARKLGLVEASGRKKRAMQFGSHSARMQLGEADRRGDLMIT